MVRDFRVSWDHLILIVEVNRLFFSVPGSLSFTEFTSFRVGTEDIKVLVTRKGYGKV